MPPPTAWPLARVLAHRCGGALAPENTLAGLDAAAACGCRGVEFDVMLSGDGSPVLIHDETLERTTSGRGRVADAGDEVLRGLDAGAWFAPRFAGEQIPFLDACAARCRALNLSVNLEIKPSTGYEAETGRVAAGHARRLWAGALPPLLSSFSEEALAAAAEAAPELPRALLVERVPHDWRERCARVGAVALHAEATSLDRGVVEAVRATGLWMASYTVNAIEYAEMLFEWGVDCVITDRPDRVRAPSSPLAGRS